MRRVTCTHVVDSLVRTVKNNSADACAFASEPQLLPSQSVQDGSDSQESCTQVSTPWSVFRNSNDEGIKKNSFVSVFVREPGTGGQEMETRAWAERDNRHVRQHRDAEIVQVAIFGDLNAVQRRTPGAVRCAAPSWTSEVRMPELPACRSARVRRHRDAVECRLRQSSSDASAVVHTGGPPQPVLA